MSERSNTTRLTRRNLLGFAAAGATLAIPALGCAAPGAATPPAKPGPVPAPPTSSTSAGVPGGAPTTPDEALAILEAGNQRFVQGRVTAPHRNLERLKEVAPKQAPFAAFLGCADSRVPIEIVFDQGFGDIFVTRIAGNIADPTIIGSLEFGTLVLGAKVLYVLGHTSCGAVSATLKGEAVPGQISSLYQHIRPAVKTSGGDVAKAIESNVRNQMEILSEASPVVGGLIKDGKLKVVGGIYDLTTGRVSPVKLV